MIDTASLNILLRDLRRIAAHREQLTENRIQKIYESLMKDLNGFLGEEYIQYGDAEGRLYLAYLDAKNQRAKFLSEMVKRCDGISEDIKSEIASLVDETYAKSYKGMLKAFKAANKGGIFEQATQDIAVNANVLKQAVSNNISKLTLPAVLEKHRNEIIYQIQQELNIGLMQGDRYEQMAKRISERVGVSESKAKNIVRTESHRNVESGFIDCAEHIQEGLDGSNLIYAATWCTMKDERVRPQQQRKTKKGWKTTRSRNGANHVKMEGKTVKAGELFDLGSEAKAKAPGESGVAAHDCNCRCFLEYNLMTAEEFAEATGSNTNHFVEAESISDAERYAEKFAKNVSFKGVNNLDGVNGVNKTLEYLTINYPTNKLQTLRTNGRLQRSNARSNSETLEINTSFLNKNLKKDNYKEWLERTKQYDDLLKEYETKYLGSPGYDQYKIKKYVKQMKEEKKYGRWHVAETVDDTIVHEYGHIIADQYIGQINGRLANPNFAAVVDNKLYKACNKVRSVYVKARKSGDIFKISMYASADEREFFAETFTMYVKGEKLPEYIIDMLEEVLNGGIL